MNVIDFVYDDIALSQLGYMICDLNGGGDLNETENATRTFNNISMYNGKFMPFTSTVYEDRLEFSFDIIKLICSGSEKPTISSKEAQYLMRWLARPNANKLKFVHSDYADVYYEGSFNVTDLKIGDDRIGLRLMFVTNKPFGSYEAIWEKKEFTSTSDEMVITDISDDAGYIYPYIEITCNEGGNLCLTNSYDSRDTIINGCSEGEKIIITENLIMSSTMLDHKVQNDFNYEFLKISNNFTNRTNRITSTMKCEVLISYNPIAKVVY